jgi:hypothetical protein
MKVRQVSMKRVLALLVMLVSGCGGKQETSDLPPVLFHERDCVKDDFAFDFYTSHDQGRIIYCYAQLQTIARQYAQEHPEKFK